MVTPRIAIIPARGGSKRLPEKNIIDFFGKPMIAWTIQAALHSGLFERVLVSTDDKKIASISQEWGAEVPFFRSESADDHSPVSMATYAALQQASSYWDRTFSTVVQLMANCPLRGPDNIHNALFSFERGNHDSNFQISCFRFGWMNPWWAAELDDEGRPIRLFPETANKRSQDLPPLFCPTGAIWIGCVTDFMTEKTFYGEKLRFEPMPWENAVDIDDYDDLKFAHAVAQMIGLKIN